MRRPFVLAAVLSCAALAPHGAGAQQAPQKPAAPAAKAPPPAKPTKPAQKPMIAAKAAPAKPGYATYVRTWHAQAEGTPETDAQGRPLLVLTTLMGRDRVAVPAASDAGGFGAHDLDRVSEVLREPSSGNRHPVEARLVDVLYQLQTHFHAQELRVVSGYRTPRRGRGSNHGKGRAADIVVPGASDQDVATFARRLGFVGVGIYPTSGFVHVDVRDRSYFWVDASGPGRKNRERGILGDLAKQSDADAAARGEHGTPPLLVALDVDAALGRMAAPVPPDAHEEEDEDL
jgi:uncharacterized protein YcbK (DUF882 family)